MCDFQQRMKYAAFVFLGAALGTGASAIASVDPPRGAEAPEGQAPRVGQNGAAHLPLQRGFYVHTDVACGEASAASLLLFRGAAISGSRDLCSFQQVLQIASDTWQVHESCEVSEGGRAWVVDSQSTWRITSPTSFERTNEEGWEVRARLCEQSSLPEPWSDNDIADLLH